jgi:pyruvate,water dikinase
MSDFKSNEYANLIGGKYFEPDEENPMIGFRGASRYYSDFYRKGFALECDEKKCETKWVFNVKLMIPFVELSKKEKGAEMAAKNYKEKTVLSIRHDRNPSNVILADEFASLLTDFQSVPMI